MSAGKLMQRKEYSAGMVSDSFWFSEFKKMIELLNSGMAFGEIKEKNKNENIFMAPSETRSIRIFNTVSRRIRALDKKILNLFEQSDIFNQKLIALIAVMESDSLFFDFINEVYREKLIIGVDEITDTDIKIFFQDKRVQSERVAKWKDHTLTNLASVYKTILMEAGVLERASDTRKILKPIMDRSLEDKLKECGMESTLRALTGEK